MIVYRELKSIEKDLGFDAKTLYGLSNNIPAHYHKAFIPKSDGTKRELSVPDFILKQVQKSIADNILAYYPVSRFAQGYVFGSSVRKNAMPHVGKRKVLKLDIEGFFDHIRYSKVKDIVFFKEKFSERIRILLTMLCYYRDVLPQGAPSSPAITNIVMFDFDEKIGEYCETNGISYTRYCDDMTFSGDFNEKTVIELVKRELKKLGLFLKNRKTVVVPYSKRQTVTGIVVNEKVNPTRDYRKKIRMEIYCIQKFGLSDHLTRIGETDREEYLNCLKGRVAYVLQIVPRNKEFMKYKDFLKNVSNDRGI